MLYSYSDQVDQISDYVTAAKLLGRPLWLYTRVDTLLSSQFYSLVASTGGGVVAYFTTPDYVDPVDSAARSGLIAALVILAILGLWEIRARWKPTQAVQRPKDPPTPAQDKADHAEDFVKAAKDRAQRKIDVEDARHDDFK